MDKTKLILIGVAVVLVVVIGVLIYRIGIINERKGDLEAQMTARKEKVYKLLKQAEKYQKQNIKLLNEISDLHCTVDRLNEGIDKRDLQIKKIKQDVQANIDSYVSDSNRIGIFSDLIK